MPIKVQWDDPNNKTVLLYTVQGNWAWSEFYAAIDEGRGKMETIPGSRIHSIVDITRGHLFPANALSHFARMSNSPHPKAGLLVIVGMGTFVRALANILNHYKSGSANHILIAQTLEEAHDMLARQADPKIGVV